MKRLKVKFTLEAAGIVRKLHPDTKGIVKSGILEIQKSPHVGHQLQAELYGFMSHKIKRYRIIYQFDENEQTIEIYHVGHRKDVYEQFRRILHQIT